MFIWKKKNVQLYNKTWPAGPIIINVIGHTKLNFQMKKKIQF